MDTIGERVRTKHAARIRITCRRRRFVGCTSQLFVENGGKALQRRVTNGRGR